ncbi:MAG: polysaccharide pyruvyl transferase family protein [Prosthecobacter sp.]|uniref:polysaccharide pyruvyl transferase family protein n=1 Tax=Prosthecobacter sp. TaxID=1965333 RepID=UPI0039039BC4
MNRRHFIHSAAALPFISAIAAEKPKRLVLRSSWQTVNIGDIAHTPGVLALLEKHLPDVEVRLWPSNLDNGVAEMLAARFPKVTVIRGEAVKTAFEECDFLLHGSGPSLVAEKDVVKWSQATGKPYGVYGITFSGQQASKDKSKPVPKTIDVLSGAKFAYFRDSVSLELAKKMGCTCPLMEFGPDGAFAVDLKDDAKAEAFLKAHGLEEGKFLCCIPRMRNTPYWTLPEKKAALDEKRHARNEAMKDHDGKPLLDAIVSVIKNTDLKILLCPEDKTQMKISKEMLYDKLPEDVKSRVVWRENYWLTDEAISTYRRSAGLFGHEMHSPIMCIGNGIPAIVCRWAEQTSKGFMWRDIGLNDWLFDLDKDDELARVAETVLAMAKDPVGSKAKAAKARDFVMGKFAASMGVVKGQLPA